MLTEKKIQATNKAGRYTDEPTLHLFVKQGARGIKRLWVQRITVYGIRRELGLGPWPIVTLDEARQLAYDNRRIVQQGGDPLTAKPHAVPTFAQAADRYFADIKPTLKPGRSITTWMDPLRLYVLPKIGKVPVDKLTREHVLHCLTPIWLTKRDPSKKAKSKITSVLKWCQGHGFVEGIVSEQVNGALAKKPKGDNMRAVPFKGIADVCRAIRHAPTTEAARLCVLFLIVTATRSQEARLADWSEIDFDGKVWTIPASHTKLNKPFRVPLSDVAVSILVAAQARRHDRWVFPSPHGHDPIHEATVRKVMPDAKVDRLGSLHGFRSTFRTWAQETKAGDHETLEMCLAHQVGNSVAKAYARGDLFDRRKPVMQAWADFITGKRPWVFTR